jgi:predicted GTPase
MIHLRPLAPAELGRKFRDHPHLGDLLLAVGYRDARLRELAMTILATTAEVVVSTTPILLEGLVRVDEPNVSVS